MSDFRVPFGPSETEFTEKRSRFIGHLLPVETEEQAREFIAQIKKKYYDARHNCWCYLIGGDTMRYGDDGEPQGTAGQPMLNVFQRENVTNVVCVVTRYFGGILLGAGGLTRAYSKSARDALVAAGVSEMGLWAMADIPCPYALFERVRGEVTALGGTVDSADYGADIRLTVSLPAENTAALRERLTELSAGGIVLTVTAIPYRQPSSSPSLRKYPSRNPITGSTYTSATTPSSFFVLLSTTTFSPGCALGSFLARALIAAPVMPQPAHSSQSWPQAVFRGTDISAYPPGNSFSTVAICVIISPLGNTHVSGISGAVWSSPPAGTAGSVCGGVSVMVSVNS